MFPVGRSIGHAEIGWTLVGVTVIAYDAYALATGKETLSGAFWRCQESRWGRAVVAGWIGLNWHLIVGKRALLPPRYRETYRRYHPLWAANGYLRTIHSKRIQVNHEPEDPS